MGADADPRFLTYDTHILRGIRRFFTVPSPAAGAEWSQSVPGGRMWRLIGGQFQIVTSATVANRTVGFQFKLGGITTQFGFNTTAVPASTTRQAVFQYGSAATSGAGLSTFLALLFSYTWFEPGDSIGSLSGSLDPADQYSAITLIVEEAFFTAKMLSDLAMRNGHGKDGYPEQAASDYFRIGEHATSDAGELPGERRG